MGVNMSWILVEGIDQEALLAALDLVPTGELPLEGGYDLGTSHVPLAAATFDSRWCAVFARYALMMDATVGTDPPRLVRLPIQSRCVTCVTLEHAMVSYSSLWQDGHHVWQIRHDQSQGVDHLDVSGALHADFAGIRDTAVQRRRAAEEAVRKHGARVQAIEAGQLDLGHVLGRMNYVIAGAGFALGPADYAFDVPFDVAATITGFCHTRAEAWELLTNLRALEPSNGNVLTRLSHPPKWWQTLRSIEYQ